MKLILNLILFSVIISSSVFAGMRHTIYDVIEPEKDGENYLVLVDDGRIYEVKDSALLSTVYTAMNEGRPVEVKFHTGSILKSNLFQERETIKKISILSEKDLDQDRIYTPEPTAMDNFEPTVVESMDKAQNLYDSLRKRAKKKSQCYNRAMVWAYEMFQNYGIKSHKMFIFFTRKYIREYKWKWWFHVAPMILVKDQKEPIIIDREYKTGIAQTLTDWKNNYIKPKTPCKEVKYYSDWYDHQYGETNCYFVRAKMYYWQPGDLKRLEEDRVEVKNSFDSFDLRYAYRQAYRIKFGDEE